MLVRRTWWRVLIRPPVSFVMYVSFVLVRAHSCGKNVEMSFRAPVGEMGGMLSSAFVNAMIAWGFVRLFNLWIGGLRVCDVCSRSESDAVVVWRGSCYLRSSWRIQTLLVIVSHNC